MRLDANLHFRDCRANAADNAWMSDAEAGMTRESIPGALHDRIGLANPLLRRVSRSMTMIGRNMALLALLLVAGPAMAEGVVRRCQPAKIQPGVNDIDLWRAGDRFTAEMWFYKDFVGTVCLETRRDAGFRIDWDASTYGFLHEFGLYDLKVAADAVRPDATARFVHTLVDGGGGGGYTGLYGWFGKAGSPDAIELYINENWSGGDKGVPGIKDMSETIRMGSMTVDGGTYDIYTRPRSGTKFAQWWSNRRTKRSAGTISYARHFAAWRKLGMPDAVLTRLTFALESRWGAPSKGSVTYTVHDIEDPDRARAR
jgi:Glycosyl hydrolases family 11